MSLISISAELNKYNPGWIWYLFFPPQAWSASLYRLLCFHKLLLCYSLTLDRNVELHSQHSKLEECKILLRDIQPYLPFSEQDWWHFHRDLISPWKLANRTRYTTRITLTHQLLIVISSQHRRDEIPLLTKLGYLHEPSLYALWAHRYYTALIKKYVVFQNLQ